VLVVGRNRRQILFGGVESKRGPMYVDERPDGSSPKIAGFLYQRLQVLRVTEVWWWCAEGNRREEGKQWDGRG
jgi:hypothetical protein